MSYFLYLLFNATATSEIYTLSLHDALPIFTGGAAGVHSRSCDVTVLRIASPRAGPHARRFLCLLDAVLLRQGRDERLDERPLGEPRRARRSLRGQDGPEAHRRLSAGAALYGPAWSVHDAAHVHRADVRDDHVALRLERTDHRPHPVLLAHRRGRAFGNRSDRDRTTLLPAAYSRASGPDSAGRAGALGLGVRCGRA